MRQCTILAATLSGLLTATAWSQVPSQPPPAPREFRAAWVATVNNIDWPSKRGLDGDEQRREILAILDKAVQLKLNCLIVQVRTTADALYESKLEPWSAYLSGTQGQPPSPPYDPLRVWIEEGHKRGIEIHAWFNPYRAGFRNVALAETHIGVRRPELVVSYGTHLWLDPGNPDAAAHSLAVFNDVVRRYDVDGIHIDDYFYPYPIKVSWDEDQKNPDPDDEEREARAKRPELPFPDDASWAKHKAKHPVQPNPATRPADVERIARDDWRRDSVNRLVKAIYENKQKTKPWVKFGISPFGIGRPGTAPGIKGFDQYDKLYADAALWLREGWCDYWTPQLYWPIEQKEQSFPVLLDYWISENKKERHVWPGLFTSQINNRPATQPSTRRASTRPAAPPRQWLWSAQEIADQVEVTRSRGGEPGHVHFSMKALMRDTLGVSTLLESQTYQVDALVPATPWLDDKPPAKPAATLAVRQGKTVLSFRPGRGEPIRVFAVWKLRGGEWSFQTVPAGVAAVELESDVTEAVVTAVDRSGNESERVRAKR